MNRIFINVNLDRERTEVQCMVLALFGFFATVVSVHLVLAVVDYSSGTVEDRQ